MIDSKSGRGNVETSWLDFLERTRKTRQFRPLATTLEEQAFGVTCQSRSFPKTVNIQVWSKADQAISRSSYMSQSRHTSMSRSGYFDTYLPLFLIQVICTLSYTDKSVSGGKIRLLKFQIFIMAFCTLSFTPVHCMLTFHEIMIIDDR